MSQDRPRVLVFGGNFAAAPPVPDLLGRHFEVNVFDTPEAAMAALREQDYHAVMADVGDFLPLERAIVGDRSTLILNTIGEGVCIVDADGRRSWSNKRMKTFAPEVSEHVRRVCVQALQLFINQTGAINDAIQTRNKKFTFQDAERYFEMICSPVTNEAGQVQQVVAVVWDATSGKRLQAKIDAIDAAGRELARIDKDAVEKLTPADRLKLLQDKIIRYSKDLMHFDHFAIRLLDKRANKLEVVIAEGLPPEALEIDLYAQPEGNGISGFVAATGRSYICHDTEKDPRYVIGLDHAHSSMTVPLSFFDEVVGVYNVESSTVGALSEDDRQFAEIFGRYVAQALNLLDLLVVERFTTSGKISDAVVQEMAQPLNDIVTEAQSMIEEYIGDDAMRARLNRIVDHTQAIRQSISDVAAGPKAVIGCDKIAESRQDPLLAGKRVLIADDEPNIRRTIKDVLAKHGCDVVTCKDGYEACTEIEQENFDLIISDIKMPYRNGYEIFASAQRRDEGTPVLLMTGFGYDPNHSIVRASQEGLSCVLFKPFKVERLLEEIRTALGAPAEEPEQAEAND